MLLDDFTADVPVLCGVKTSGCRLSAFLTVTWQQLHKLICTQGTGGMRLRPLDGRTAAPPSLGSWLCFDPSWVYSAALSSHSDHEACRLGDAGAETSEHIEAVQDFLRFEGKLNTDQKT